MLVVLPLAVCSTPAKSENNLYLTGTESNVTLAEAQVSENLGLPFSGTMRWAIPMQAYQQDFWFISMPPYEGWYREDGTYFSYQQMMNAVTNVEIETSQPNWFPPFVPPRPN